MLRNSSFRCSGDQSNLSRCFGAGLGLFLLAASFFKTYALLNKPLPDLTFLTSPKIILLAAEIELLLGVWLISGWNRNVAWKATFVFFGILVFASLYMIWIKIPSCSCLGVYSVSPRWMLVLDLVVLFFLAILCPCETTLQKQWFPVFPMAAIGFCLFILVFGFFTISTTWARWSITHLSGEFLEISPKLTDLGEAKWKTNKTFFIKVKNQSTKPVKIFGGMQDCALSTLKNLPVEIQPNQAKEIEIEISFRGEPGQFKRQYFLYSDLENQKMVVADYSWTVVP